VIKSRFGNLHTSKDEDNLPHLVSMFFDNHLSDADSNKLQLRLQIDPVARRFYTQYAVMQSHITLHFNHGLDYETAVKSKPLHSQARFLSLERIIYFSIIGIAVLVCASVFGLRQFVQPEDRDDAKLFQYPYIARIERSEAVKWQDEVTRPVKTFLRDKEPLSLLEGEVELRLKSGTTLVFHGPAQFQIEDDNISLSLGKIIADVTKKDIGFCVNTPSGRVVDLGTTFSVTVSPEKITEVQVFRGKVSLSNYDEEGTERFAKTLSANQAAEFTTEEISDAIFSSIGFLQVISRDYAISDFSENNILQENIPDAVAAGLFDQYEDDQKVFVFPEKQNVLLKTDVQASIRRPGTYQEEREIAQQHDIIPDGTRVDSFRIYFNPVGHPPQMMVIQGQIRFDRPVIGILTSNRQLLETSALFSSLLVDSPSRLTISSSNKTEIIKPEHHDVLALSDDRKVITYTFMAYGKFVDDLRVLIESER
tara:strand:- start:168 stop:1604 length:1437 start_codon:yes stop_codon:yes gene_type:complete